MQVLVEYANLCQYILHTVPLQAPFPKWRQFHSFPEYQDGGWEKWNARRKSGLEEGGRGGSYPISEQDSIDMYSTIQYACLPNKGGRRDSLGSVERGRGKEGTTARNLFPCVLLRRIERQEKT